MREVYRVRDAPLESARNVLFAVLMSMVLAGCGSNQPVAKDEATPKDAAPAVTSGLAATERFMETWNTRDPVAWASSLHFPHARPSAGGLRMWATEDEYFAGADYESVIATGWDHTEFEDLQIVHEGDAKAHIAGRWVRFDTAGSVMRRNLVTYVATEVDGHWGIQARFGAGAPLPVFEDQYRIGRGGRAYDIAPDGQRFLFITQGLRQGDEDQGGPHLIFVQNWHQELLERVPIP